MLSHEGSDRHVSRLARWYFTNAWDICVPVTVKKTTKFNV